MSDPRLFVAIPIPPDIRSALKQEMESMRMLYRFHKWVHPDDLHITLKFLGAASPEARRQMVQGLSDLTGSLGSFTLRLEGWGTFGRPASPGILWEGVGGDLDRLSLLQAAVEQAASQSGFEREEHPYRPHLTVARKYSGASPFQLDQWTAHLKNQDVPLRTWRVQEVVLYQSHLGRTPMYEKIELFHLADDEGILQHI
ncbi:RNA 2',3'-cyclic phosphodiesterase [Paenibacillus sp. EPM92]|uniref:RNA 2',3'-cyclic phosphodiesterase n=1 Tax=Paenibacillus sp. EPM92 TaxID=1561195 RepID=UPI0019163632|nr:RNA 2',3'-cyclic phosphodiesterase [Paenibacillus sp. EPM92]